MCNESGNYEVFNFSIIRAGANFLKVKNGVLKIFNVDISLLNASVALI